ncbi:hypothetical protein EJB05_43336, partial [Eragrostis curvula]
MDGELCSLVKVSAPVPPASPRSCPWWRSFYAAPSAFFLTWLGSFNLLLLAARRRSRGQGTTAEGVDGSVK